MQFLGPFFNEFACVLHHILLTLIRGSPIGTPASPPLSSTRSSATVGGSSRSARACSGSAASSRQNFSRCNGTAGSLSLPLSLSLSLRWKHSTEHRFTRTSALLYPSARAASGVSVSPPSCHTPHDLVLLNIDLSAVLQRRKRWFKCLYTARALLSEVMRDFMAKCISGTNRDDVMINDTFRSAHALKAEVFVCGQVSRKWRRQWGSWVNLGWRLCAFSLVSDASARARDKLNAKLYARPRAFLRLLRRCFEQ